MTMPIRFRIAAVLAAGALLASVAQAALKPGDTAPAFSTEAARGGTVSRFQLSEALARGPVVLYFFPKAFTQGCTVEAHLFAEASDKFAALGATVVGVSADNIDTLKRFSVEACRNAFPVAIATPDVIKSYDVSLKQKPVLTDRTSYVIDRKGRIAFVHSDLEWSEHVSKTLAAVRALKR